MSEIKTEIRQYWNKIKQWPLYILLGLTSLWLILPFSFWLLRGEAVKNLDQLIQELQQKQEDIQHTKITLEKYKQDQKIELTTAQKDSLKRLARHDENTLLQILLFLVREFPLYLFFLMVGILLESRYHFSVRFKTLPSANSVKSTAPKIKIYSPTTPTSPSTATSTASEENEVAETGETAFEERTDEAPSH